MAALTHLISYHLDPLRTIQFRKVKRQILTRDCVARRSSGLHEFRSSGPVLRSFLDRSDAQIAADPNVIFAANLKGMFDVSHDEVSVASTIYIKGGMMKIPTTPPFSAMARKSASSLFRG